MIKRWAIAAILAAGSIAAQAQTNMHAVARMAARDIDYALTSGHDSRTQRVSPEGALVTVSVQFGQGETAGIAPEPGRWSRTKKGWTFAASGLAAIAAVDRVAAPNGWLWHKDREKDWAGVVDRSQYPASADSKSSGTQSTDAGGNNYYAEGDMYVQHAERREHSDNE